MKQRNEPHCGVIELIISSSNDSTHWIIVSGLAGGEYTFSKTVTSLQLQYAVDTCIKACKINKRMVIREIKLK